MVSPREYGDGVDAERALKYAVQRVRGGRAEVVEGVIDPLSYGWDHERTRDVLRAQLSGAAERLRCVAGSGDLDLPGSPNWYVPDLAVVPESLTRGAGALVPGQTLLVAEVASESSAETDRIVKRRRYAEYGAPLYLLVDRLERSVTLFAEPGSLGYTKVDGPHPFGTVVRLPEPFDVDLDTGGL
ncbi:Uma2 family endonuclease [Streptomyces yangpuensis]|uniref:Uma2 family endonuclease n=1 Tax=Streptomyces yangpuensis TaxID=1648182 RepID=UPI00062999A1|nr:Uma2 family endonuclease [Streptomyces yangpuensis]